MENTRPRVRVSSRRLASGWAKPRKGRKSGMRRVVGSLVAMTFIVALVSACSASSPSVSEVSVSTTTAADRASRTCADPVHAALPTWATSGFNNTAVTPPYLAGTRQTMVAVPFGWPLLDRPTADHANKILWIAQTGTGPLRIVATEQASGQTVTKDLPDGPGPSYVDMPTAGCWQFAVSWADQHDEFFIRYTSPST